MYKTLMEKIINAKNISIFKHQRPDGDCVFASYALKEFINCNFKDKKVKLIGTSEYDVFGKNDVASDNFIRNSLAIIVDVSTKNRIDDNRFEIANDIIIVDHHPIFELPDNVKDYIIDPSCAAVCELLAKIFYSKNYKNYHISKLCNEYLYCGILTDSNSFTTSSTSYKTLQIAAKLIKNGDLSISDIHYKLFAHDLDLLKKIDSLTYYLKTKDNVGYIILNKKDLDKLGMNYSEAKNAIDKFSLIKGVDIWTVFAYNPEHKLYDGSIRSKKAFVINEVAKKYNGGGHKNACGVKRLSIDDINNLLTDLTNIKMKKFSNKKAK